METLDACLSYLCALTPPLDYFVRADDDGGAQNTCALPANSSFVRLDFSSTGVMGAPLAFTGPAHGCPLRYVHNLNLGALVHTVHLCYAALRKVCISCTHSVRVHIYSLTAPLRVPAAAARRRPVDNRRLTSL